MRKLLVLLILVVLFVPAVATAQDGWQSHTHESGEISVSYPPDWFATNNIPDDGEETTGISISNNEDGFGLFGGNLTNNDVWVIVTIVDEDGFADFSVVGLEDQSVSIMAGFMVGYLAMASNLIPSFSDDAETNPIIILEYSEEGVAGYQTGLLLAEINGNDVMIGLSSISDDSMLWTISATPLGEFDQHEETIMQILESVTLNETE